MLVHPSFVSVRAVAGSVPWQTLQFISKRVFPSGKGAAAGAAGVAVAAGGAGSCLAQPMAKTKTITDRTPGTTVRTRISGFPLGGTIFGVSYPAPRGDSTVPSGHAIMRG